VAHIPSSLLSLCVHTLSLHTENASLSPTFVVRTLCFSDCAASTQALSLCRVSMFHLPACGFNSFRQARYTWLQCQLLPQETMEVPPNLGSSSCNSCIGPSDLPPLPLHADNTFFFVSPLLSSGELCRSDFAASKSISDVDLV
jgi:hypothetical protein